MPQPTDGNTVKVHCTGTRKDGSQFDSSIGRDPLEFVIGEGRVLPAFEKLVCEMEPGDKKTVTIPCDDAYGIPDPRRLIEMDRKQLPDDVQVAAGQFVELTRPDGATIPALVSSVTDDTIVCDANHPLAGEDLTFEIELVEIA